MRYFIATALTATVALGAAASAQAQTTDQNTYRPRQSRYGIDTNYGPYQRAYRYNWDSNDSVYGDHGLYRLYDPYDSRRLGRPDFDRYSVYPDGRRYGQNYYGRGGYGRGYNPYRYYGYGPYQSGYRGVYINPNRGLDINTGDFRFRLGW